MVKEDMQELIGWYLGGTRENQYVKLIKRGVDPYKAYRKVLEKTIKEGDPRARGIMGKIAKITT